MSVPDRDPLLQAGDNARTVARASGPAEQILQLVDVAIFGEEFFAARDRVAQTTQADVIAASLHQHGRELQRNHGVE